MPDNTLKEYVLQTTHIQPTYQTDVTNLKL